MATTKEDYPYMGDPVKAVANLLARFDRMPHPIFAAMDGAHFDDIQSEMGRKNIPCKSLFLGAGRETELNGPWLVSLLDEDSEQYVASIAAERPCAVFWSCPDGEDALYRHLRSLNEVLIPKSALPKDTTKPGVIAAKDYARVFFRHYDPNVLGELIPSINAAQFARFLGPAREVVWYAPDYGGRRSAINEDDLPEAPRGALKLEETNIKEMERRRLEGLRRWRVAYLKDCAPEQAAGKSDAELARFVIDEERKITAYGVKGQDKIAMWTYMQFTCPTDLNTDTGVRKYLSNKEHKVSPDQRVEHLFDLRTQLLLGG